MVLILTSYDDVSLKTVNTILHFWMMDHNHNIRQWMGNWMESCKVIFCEEENPGQLSVSLGYKYSPRGQNQ